MFGSTCSHAWYYVSGYALLRSTCLYACSVLLCQCPCRSHAYILGFAFSYASMFISTCLDVYPHAYMRISMLICVDRCVYMLRSMFSTCFMLSSMCLRASRHVYVLRPRPCLSCHVLLYPFCSFYRIFLCFGPMVRTRSRPHDLCHRPYIKAHIKGFGSSYLHVYTCLLLCFYAFMLYACASLSCSRLCHAWHLPRAWSCLVTSDAHEALFGCDHLGSISGCRVASYIPFPFRSMRCYAYHACLCHLLAFYASLHACLHVHAWVLLASVSSLLQHNEVMDIWSKSTFVPRGHHILFVFLLFCLLTCLRTFLFLCLPCLSWLSALYLFHMLFTSFPSIACLLVSCLCLYMYTHGARMHGARALSPKRKQKGRGCKHVDISQAAISRDFGV